MQNTNLAGPLGGFLSTGDERLAGWPLLVCVRASLWFGGVAGTAQEIFGGWWWTEIKAPGLAGGRLAASARGGSPTLKSGLRVPALGVVQESAGAAKSSAPPRGPVPTGQLAPGLHPWSTQLPWAPSSGGDDPPALIAARA